MADRTRADLSRAGLPALLFTCEHAGNRIPKPLSPLFEGREELLASHRGYDIGALELARSLARSFAAPLVWSDVSRLVVELNRTPGNPGLFSEMTAPLPSCIRQDLMARYHRPHQRGVEMLVAGLMGEPGRVVHVAVHSFTPVLGGVARNADVGLLYDPARPGEKALCLAWRAALAEADPGIRVRRNYPYRGTSDGLPRLLRTRHSDRSYVGVELEANQGLHESPQGWRQLGLALAASLRKALAALSSADRG